MSMLKALELYVHFKQVNFMACNSISLFLKNPVISIPEFGSRYFGLLLPLGTGRRKKVNSSLENESVPLGHKLILILQIQC